jgi:hypothetical protein
MGRPELYSTQEERRQAALDSQHRYAEKSRSKIRNDLTAKRLRELLSYDPATGIFRWRVISNTRMPAGSIAGTANQGYRRIKIDRREYGAHQLAWLYVHGRFPDANLDHIDGRRDNNVLSNLREASRAENLANSHRRATPVGSKGATKYHKKYRANISTEGRSIYLGLFATQAEAHAACMAAAVKLYGDFANDGVRRVALEGHIQIRRAA